MEDSLHEFFTEVEKEKEVEEMFEGWKLIKSKIAGQSRYCLLQKK